MPIYQMSIDELLPYLRAMADRVPYTVKKEGFNEAIHTVISMIEGPAPPSTCRDDGDAYEAHRANVARLIEWNRERAADYRLRYYNMPSSAQRSTLNALARGHTETADALTEHLEVLEMAERQEETP